MSHISRIRTKLKTIHPQILEKTIEALKNIYPELQVYINDGSKKDLYVTVYGDIIFELKDDEGNRRYIGLINNNGSVDVVYDPFLWKKKSEQFIKDFMKFYTTNSIVYVATTLGYKMENATIMDNGNVYVELVKTI